MFLGALKTSLTRTGIVVGEHTPRNEMVISGSPSYILNTLKLAAVQPLAREPLAHPVLSAHRARCRVAESWRCRALLVECKVVES